MIVPANSQSFFTGTVPPNGMVRAGAPGSVYIDSLRGDVWTHPTGNSSVGWMRKGNVFNEPAGGQIVDVSVDGILYGRKDRSWLTLAAGVIPNTPAGNIAATNVQDAVNELDAEKQPLALATTILAKLTQMMIANGNIPIFTGTDSVGVTTLSGASVAYATSAGTAAYATSAGTAAYATSAGSSLTSSTAGTAIAATASGELRTAVNEAASAVQPAGLTSASVLYATSAGSSLTSSTASTAIAATASGELRNAVNNALAALKGYAPYNAGSAFTGNVSIDCVNGGFQEATMTGSTLARTLNIPASGTKGLFVELWLNSDASGSYARTIAMGTGFDIPTDSGIVFPKTLTSGKGYLIKVKCLDSTHWRLLALEGGYSL